MNRLSRSYNSIHMGFRQKFFLLLLRQRTFRMITKLLVYDPHRKMFNFTRWKGHKWNETSDITTGAN